MASLMITGAGRGIGFELAKQALLKGWTVYGSVRSEAAKKELSAALPDMKVLVFDVTDHQAVDRAAAALASPLDIVVNNAGVIGPSNQSTTNMDFDGFRETLEINVLAPLKVSQAFLPNLKKSDNPRLVTISSQMGGMDCSKSDRIAYRASKSAVNKIVQAFATDFAKDGICCVSMHPGWVQTDMGGATADISPSQSAAGILHVIDELTFSQSGSFINWDGTLRVW